MVSSVRPSAGGRARRRPTRALPTPRPTTTTATTPRPTRPRPTEPTTTATTTIERADPATHDYRRRPARRPGRSAGAAQRRARHRRSRPRPPPQPRRAVSRRRPASDREHGRERLAERSRRGRGRAAREPLRSRFWRHSRRTSRRGIRTRKQAKASYASLHKAPKPYEVEPEAGSSGTTGNVHWINRAAARPDAGIASADARSSRSNFARPARPEGLDWAFLLAVLRAERLEQLGPGLALRCCNARPPSSARFTSGQAIARRCCAYKHEWPFTRRVLVLEHYYEALGLKALVNGLAASRDRPRGQDAGRSADRDLPGRPRRHLLRDAWTCACWR